MKKIISTVAFSLLLIGSGTVYANSIKSDNVDFNSCPYYNGENWENSRRDCPYVDYNENLNENSEEYIKSHRKYHNKNYRHNRNIRMNRMGKHHNRGRGCHR